VPPYVLRVNVAPQNALIPAHVQKKPKRLSMG